MNTLKIEMTSITKLKDIFNRCERIIPAITENDKTPSWDGNLEIFSSYELVKNDLESLIKVQVKGKYIGGITSEGTFDNTIKFPIDIADFKNYKNDGGVLFFVVLLKNFDEFNIYYNVFLPWDLKVIFEGLSVGQKSKSIDFIQFPLCDEKMIMDICLNFLEERKNKLAQ